MMIAVTGFALAVACSNPSAAALNRSAASSPDSTGPVATPADVSAAPAPPAGGSREILLPAGTLLPIRLETSVGSDISRVEQPVEGRLRRALIVHGVEVLPAGTIVKGHVTAVRRPGKVQGRGYVAMRFTEVDTRGSGLEHITTAAVSRTAPTTRQKDAVEILGPAAAGAVIGRLAGGKGAAATGALIGGAAGTGYVLSTRGKDVRVGKGTPLSVKLTRSVDIRAEAIR
jgi:hypothetical protein